VFPVGDGVQNPSLFNVDANYKCDTSKLIKTIQRDNFIEGKGAKCNQIRREQQTVELDLTLKNDTNVTITVTGSVYSFDYGGQSPKNNP